ncbi:MAG: hypothetical protein IJ859_07090 [Synergistaceae bacterium]|nr:hypothetical protein [Synergistaceae bacterium]
MKSKNLFTSAAQILILIKIVGYDILPRGLIMTNLVKNKIKERREFNHEAFTGCPLWIKGNV